MKMDLCNIREHLIRGHHAVTLEHARISVTVLPEKGGEIYAIVYKPAQFDVLWKAPWGLRRPGPASTADGGSEAAWLDSYAGGWQGIFPNGGDSCVYKQATLGFHGEGSTAAWDYHCASNSASARIEMEVQLRRSPFALRREVSIENGSLTVRVRETIVNQSDAALHTMWGHHPAFATDFLNGARVQTRARKFEAHDPEISPTTRFAPGSVHKWPLVTDKVGREIDLSCLPDQEQCVTEMGYLSDFEEGRLILSNPSLGISAELIWDKEVFRHLWYWLEWGGSREYPFYGRCRVAAFEPFSSIPGIGLLRAIERGTALLFDPGQRLSTELCLRLDSNPFKHAKTEY